MATDSRTYADAIDALNSLQTPFEVIEARRKAGVRPDVAAMTEMRAYLARVGYTPSDLNRLNVIHVAGTKGKGSTCALTESILTHYRRQRQRRRQRDDEGASGPAILPSKTGLLTSPHLVSVRERIRIDSKPLPEPLFARYFFEVWDALGSSTTSPSSAARPDLAPPGTRPVYARYLTLLALHAFARERVDCAVLETGIGGEYDATNMVPGPAATGITTLGIDHVFALGDTVEKIAWHKAGIMKQGSPAFTVEQRPEGAARVLRERAREKDVDMRVVDVDPRIEGVAIRPDAAFQRRNASLAIALAEAALGRIDPEGFAACERDASGLPAGFAEGLEKVVWRGRCEVKVGEGVAWHIDGAHTTDSLKLAAGWYAGESAKRRGPRALVFNQQGRTEAVDFLEGVHEGARREDGTSFDHVVFCTNVTYATGYKREFVNRQYDPKAIEAMTVQRQFAEKWKSLDPKAKTVVIPTIQEALDYVQDLGKGVEDGQSVQAFVTGSLHLVGGALGILEGADAL